MTKYLIDTKQVELHFDAANEAAEKSSKMARGAVIEAIEAGEQLCRAKECVPHGEWSVWLGKHWNYTQKTACQYMLLAANLTSGLNLLEAKSVNEALRIIADDKEEKTAPRDKRKSADVVVTTPSETGYRDDSRAATTEDPSDDDPTPDPPTQRATARGSEKVSEETKPRTQTVVPEILPDEPKDTRTLATEDVRVRAMFAVRELKQVVDVLVQPERKATAKELRKLADKLDPPKQVIPTVEDVAEYAESRGWKTFDAGKFWNHYELAGWKYGKAKTPLTKWHTAASQAWDDGHGWASTTSDGKANGYGAAHRGTTKPAKPTGASVFG